MMKIVILGNDEGIFPSFACQCKNALLSLGHDVVGLSFRRHKLHKLSFTNKFLNSWLFERIQGLSPDMVLVLKGANILPEYINVLGDVVGAKTVCWTLDEPFGRIDPQNTITNIPEYDYFFVFDPHYLEELKEINEHSYYLPCGVDPVISKEIVPVDKRKAFSTRHHISFIGSYAVKREEILNKLCSIPSVPWNLRVSGYGWAGKKSCCPIDKKIYCGWDMCKELNLSKINLNIHDPHSYTAPNIRTFEVPATNSFQLCDFLSEIPKLFRGGKEIICYAGIEDLKELIDYYLDPDNEEERNKIAKAGQERVLREHTIKHRMKEMLKIVKK